MPAAAGGRITGNEAELSVSFILTFKFKSKYFAFAAVSAPLHSAPNVG
jgi:hypothetical protein